jgi:hypothetical protein
MGAAIPFSSRASSAVGELVLFAASQSVSTRFAALVNTGITPILAGAETAPLAPTLGTESQAAWRLPFR